MGCEMGTLKQLAGMGFPGNGDPSVKERCQWACPQRRGPFTGHVAACGGIGAGGWKIRHVAENHASGILRPFSLDPNVHRKVHFFASDCPHIAVRFVESHADAGAP
jgi:hypothetical protein